MYPAPRPSPDNISFVHLGVYCLFLQQPARKGSRMKRTSKGTTGKQAAIGYIRVSTEEQAREGLSLDAQRAKIAAWCGAMGYELAGTFADEGISGHCVRKRPGLQAAVEAVCACGGVLVVYSLSRLARNTRETLELGERLGKA